MKTKLIQSNQEQDLREEILAFKAENNRSTLGFVFSHPHEGLSNLPALFNELDVDIIGSSSAGEIANRDFSDGSITVLLCDLPENSYQILCDEYGEMGEGKMAELISAKAKGLYNQPSVILFSGGIQRDGVSLVKGIQKNLGTDVPIFGGLAGDGGRFQTTYSLSRHKAYDDGLVALIMDNEKVKVAGLAVSGWKGIGKRQKISKATGNKLYQIDNEPALDVFIKHFGLENFHENDKELFAIPGQYPLELVGEGFQKLRSILGYDKEERSLLLAGGVEEGQEFKFCLSPPFEVIDSSVNQFKDFKNNHQDVDAALLVSCMARRMVFGPLIQKEIEGIYNQWEVPMAGYFAYGEIGKISASTGCDFHNCTSSLFTLTEI